MSTPFDRMPKPPQPKATSEQPEARTMEFRPEDTPKAEDTPKEDPRKDSDSPFDPVDDVMYTDIDMESLFLTGTTKYTFKVGNKLEVTVRLLEAEEVLKTNEALYSDPNRSMSVAMLDHAIQVLSYAVLKYGDKSISALPMAERISFFKRLPGVVVSAIAQKFSIFERSVTKMLSDEGFVKN